MLRNPNRKFLHECHCKKIVCEDCHIMKLAFFESEKTLPVEIDHIVTKDIYFKTIQPRQLPLRYEHFLCATGAQTHFFATVYSSAM